MKKLSKKQTIDLIQLIVLIGGAIITVYGKNNTGEQIK